MAILRFGRTLAYGALHRNAPSLHYFNLSADTRNLSLRSGSTRRKPSARARPVRYAAFCSAAVKDLLTAASWTKAGMSFDVLFVRGIVLG